MKRIDLYRGLLAACAVCGPVTPALAWTEPGHLVIAEITYDILSKNNPQLLAEIVKAIGHHPDQASFRVATDGTSGEEKQRRLFAQCSRWAMDAAGSVFDHPTWHVGGRDLSREKHHAIDPSSRFGNATEAFQLNLATWQDKTATDSEKALSLCWVMHIVGDIHAPLHVAQEVSSALPEGDRWGTRQFLREAPGSPPVGLHRYWDFAISKDTTPAGTRQMAVELVAALGAEIALPAAPQEMQQAFKGWVDQTYDLAGSDAYGPELLASISKAEAPVATDAYSDRTRRAAARQAVRAGTRLAWVLSHDPGKSAAHAREVSN